MGDYTELEGVINKLLVKVGCKSLIRHLKNFDSTYDYKSENTFKIIEAIVLQYFEISEKQLYEDMHSDNSAYGRRTMVFLITEFTNFEAKEIYEKFLGVTRQAYNKYLHAIAETMDNPNLNPVLHNAIVETSKLFTHKNDKIKWKVTTK